jgi:hypothetical protein
MLTYQQIKDFLDKLAALFRQMQLMQEAQSNLYRISLDLSQSRQLLEADYSQMTTEIDRSERIGEMIRQCVYQVDNPGLSMATPTQLASQNTSPSSLGQAGEAPRL